MKQINNTQRWRIG